MKTQGEIEAAICEGISRFEQEYMGRGPKDIRAHLIDDILFVRLQGVLTAAEQHLVKSLPAEKGRDLLKQVRTHLLETARPLLEAMVQEVTGIKVVSMHHDISTVTGEEVVLFTLAETPRFREMKKKSSDYRRAKTPYRSHVAVQAPYVSTRHAQYNASIDAKGYIKKSQNFTCYSGDTRNNENVLLSLCTKAGGSDKILEHIRRKT